ncbi:hypothetical protein DID76_01850 [Candidatus Marinamargulisbacteria bacterium SCGC AG-414-C22]|nr:hypothetical protein DID76_01850 [Candidatus Marinamargulisbacteria bacterium SCGC AG-414-C22]
MSPQEQLVALVKQKGTGKTMSKNLSEDQLTQLNNLIQNKQVHAATIATILTAFIMLDNTPTEQKWFDQLKHNYQLVIPTSCFFLFEEPNQNQDNHEFLRHIKHVLNHNDLSKDDISRALDSLFSKTVPAPLKTAFLEGERLKEESKTENITTLNYCYHKASHTDTKLPLLIDIANPYDGFNRFHNISILLAPFLAALGFPTLLHGCHHVSPKNAITPHKLLLEAAKNPLKSCNDVSQCLHNPTIGWGYADQSVFFDEFHSFVELRSQLVKRPVLATIEKFMLPFHANKTYLVTGYTHPPYRQKSIDLLDEVQDLDHYLIVRGMEGSAQLSMDRRTPAIIKNGKHFTETYLRPSQFNIPETERAEPDLSLTPADTLTFCLKAFTDTSSPAFQHIMYNALAIVTSFNLMTESDFMKIVMTKPFLTKFRASWESY